MHNNFNIFYSPDGPFGWSATRVERINKLRHNIINGANLKWSLYSHFLAITQDAGIPA